MADSAGKILLQSLTQEEYDSLPAPVRLKIEGCINEHVENFITSRALFETTRKSNDEKIQSLADKINILEKERDEVKYDVSALKEELAEVSLNLETAKNDNEKLETAIKSLEAECLEYRRQRDLAVDERNEAVKMIERRNNELQRLQEDVTTLSNQLQAAVQAKCEALANADEVESTKLALDYREKRLEQERGLLNQQVQSLTEDLAKNTAEKMNMRREYTGNLGTLRTQLAEKTEELKIATSTNAQLTETNNILNQRVESLTQKLIGQCETDNKMNENYQQEIRAQTKLAELYKGLSEDAAGKNEELTNAVKELQNLLKEASEQYGNLETKLKEKEVALEVTTEKKNLCIQELKKELDHANKLIEATKQQSLEKAVENLSPAAAATSRLLKSGLTLTQLYMQYAETSEQLMLEKEENKRLNNSISTILHEIEQKAPLLKKQREDYDYAMNTVESLTSKMDEMEVETSRLRSANLEADKVAAHFKRENKRLQETLSDLGRQVCFLLKEVEESRGNVVEMTNRSPQARTTEDLTTSAQVISKHLVTFRDIQELQVNNQKLIAVVRELSEKQEQAEREKGSLLVEQMESKLRLAELRVASLLETEAHYVKAMEVVKGQREMYRTLFQQQVAGLPLSKVEELENSVSQAQSPGRSSKPATPEAQRQSTPAKPSSPAPYAKLEMLEQRLKDKMQELNQLQEDFSTYRKERATNERMLSESLEKAREDLRATRVSKSEVVARAEVAEERFKVLKANADSYKSQIQALEKKNNNYSITIAKYEQSVSHLKDECVSANAKLSRAEVMLQNSQREYQLLKESEALLQREREMLDRQSSSQAMLMANLEMIKASFERTEAEGRMKVETKLDEAQKECSALRRRLQEEQDRFRERTDALERSTEAARTRLDEEKQVSHQLRTELEKMRLELREGKEAIEKLNTKVRTTTHKVVPDPETEKRASLLEQQLAEKDAEIICLKEQIVSAKKHAHELSDISQSSEKQLCEITASQSKYREESEARIKMLTTREVEMRKTIAELEGRVAVMSSAQQDSTTSLGGRLQLRQEELSSATTELVSLRAELTSVRAAYQAAEEKYSHEMMLHSDDMQAMNKVKKELSELSARVKGLESERDSAVEALQIGQEGWSANDAAMRAQISELNDRLGDLDKQNNVLHEQLQQLGLKVAVVQSQGNTSSTSLDTSVEDDTRSSDQLLQVLKYIRREKNIAVAQAEALRAESLRLKAQVELQTRQLDEAKELLEAERQQAKFNLTTTSKHEELLRKVDTLNALTDSNRLLRDERDKMQEKVTTLEQQLAKLETEVVTPYKERVVKLTNHSDQLATENTALKAEAARWRSRTNALIERQNKTSPEDFKRLTTDKENLTKQLASVSEELKNVKLEKAKLEEQLNNLKKENQQQSEQLANLQKSMAQLRTELAEAKAEADKKSEGLAKMSQDFIAQEAALSDIKSKELQIRQIAKKYKTQYQELIKTNEEEKKKKEAVVISLEEQEKLREEGRQEAETKQTDRVKQLSEQVTAAQTETTNLRKENEQLRAASADKEERAKVLLKNARARIMLLTDEKRKLATENSELKSKVDNFDQTKDDSDIRQRRADKEKADLIAEKERLAREVEMLTQRANLLQRQVDKLQGGVKPSTSSGVEKSSVEPPTANIKPMAGPSSSAAKQQPTQHSVTVTPWRGGGSETPFASIRPMSLQSRTVAVLPTTNQSSQAVLVPPQQQMVHTSTGAVEALSSSPTSSHTDYMPATSSGVAATIRQATVPPTQLPTQPPSAESTQDMEAEGSQAGVQASGAANPQALSIALVLPQPTAQTSTQTTQTQAQGSGQDSAVGSASTQQEQSVEQSVVSASSHVTAASDQGLVSASSNQQSMCSTVPAYYRQEVEEPVQAVSTEPVVASSESQLAEASNSAEQSPAAGVASSYANSSNTVTTSQTGPGTKRLRDSTGPTEEEAAKSMPPAKRGRAAPSASVTEGGEMLLRADGLEVEYQVPTSSQRDQEDDVILVDTDEEEEEEDEEGLPDDGGLDDGQEFEEEGDNEEGYEMEVYSRDDQEMASYEVGEGPDIDENITDQDNNEVEIIDDSNEVPNQSSSSSGAVGDEATSSVQRVVSVSSNQSYTRRSSATHIPPLNHSRQQQLLLPGTYEEVGDDSIVPSTPTLFVPRRTDGFGEAVSSPHVPSGRFTFSDNNPPTTRAGVAQVASEGMDDTRMDLSQLEDSGTGRSVPSTPLQVSPQVETHNLLQFYNEDSPPIQIVEADMQAVIDSDKYDKFIAFSHCISHDFGPPKQKRTGVTKTFTDSFGKPSKADLVNSRLIYQQLQDGAGIYSLLTKQKFNGNPTPDDYDSAFQQLTEDFKHRGFNKLICSPMGCVRDKIPIEHFVKNMVYFQQSTGALVNIITKSERGHQNFVRGMNHGQFVERIRCLISEYYGQSAQCDNILQPGQSMSLSTLYSDKMNKSLKISSAPVVLRGHVNFSVKKGNGKCYPIRIMEADMEDIIEEQKDYNTVAFSHCISGDFGDSRQMSAGVAVTFKHCFGKPTSTDLISTHLTYQQLGDSAGVYGLVTKHKYCKKPTIDDYNIAFLHLAEDFKSRRFKQLICSPMGCVRDKVPVEIFIGNIVDFQRSTSSLVTIVTKDEQSHRFLRNGLPHDEFMDKMQYLISEQYGQLNEDNGNILTSPTPDREWLPSDSKDKDNGVEMTLSHGHLQLPIIIPELVGAEVGQSSSAEEPPETNNNLHIPSITITSAPLPLPLPLTQEMPPPSEVEDVNPEEGRDVEEQDNEGAEALEEPEMDPEESGDGVSSEGEKSAAMVDEVEEGREAEATESTVLVVRGSGTARRSLRSNSGRGRGSRNPPTPIVWDENPPGTAFSAVRGSSPIFPRGRTITMTTRSVSQEQTRGNFRGRPRRSRAPFHFQPRF